MTVEITLISLFFAFFLGLIACLFNTSKKRALRYIAKFYIWLVRGTPMLVQAMFIYLGLPQLIQLLIYPDFRLTAFQAGAIVLSLNAGAYIAEILRGGIQAVDPGQMEAARSLGMSKSRSMYKVILPQALRISIPSLVNQSIITLKDTSIISAIGLAEIVYQAKIYVGKSMEFFATYTIIALFYLAFVTLLTWLSSYLEKRLNYGRKG
jgi:His/Glu/Gln/Arg/opine family amino acid ABC transporter permease subunit